MEGCSTTLEFGGTCERRGRSDESGIRWFFLFLYHKDMTFAMFCGQSQTWAGDEGGALVRGDEVHHPG